MNMHLVGCRYVGTEGVYTHTVAYERDAACPMCSAGVPFSVHSTDTLQQACAPEPSLPRLVLCKTHGVAGSYFSVDLRSARSIHTLTSEVTCAVRVDACSSSARHSQSAALMHVNLSCWRAGAGRDGGGQCAGRQAVLKLGF